MDVLQFEIDIARAELDRLAIYTGSEMLALGDIALQGDEVHEVLEVIRRLKEKRLAHLISQQTEGAQA